MQFGKAQVYAIHKIIERYLKTKEIPVDIDDASEQKIINNVIEQISLEASVVTDEQIDSLFNQSGSPTTT